MRAWRVVAPFLLPFTAVFVVFLCYPAFYSVWLSFRKASIYADLFEIFRSMDYVGLENYRRLSGDRAFYWSLLLTAYYSVVYVPLMIGLSLGLAAILNNRLPFARLFRSAYFLPHVLDLFVVSFVWKQIHAPKYGLVARLLEVVGAEDLVAGGLLAHPWWALPSVAIAVALKQAGFGMVLYLAAIQNIPADVYEAAEIDGATAWQRLTKITIPLVKPITLLLVVTGLLGCLQAFAEIYAMAEGKPYEVLPAAVPFFGGTSQGMSRVSGYYLFQTFYEAQEYGYAAAISVALLVIALPISVISFFVFQPDAAPLRERLARGRRRRAA